MTDATKSDWQRAFMDQLTGAWPGPPAYDSAFSGKELFHYTTVDGLKGIIEENCIWATAASYLNDATEIEYGCALLDGVFQDWQDANEKKIEALGLQVLSELRNTFKDPLSKSAMTTGIYVTCFCERDNLLSQWRAYGQKGGYSVGFSLLETGGKPSLSLLSPENPHFDMNLVRVTYERAKQSERLHRILTDMLPIIGSSNIRSEAEGEGEKGLATMSRIAFVIIEYFLLDEIVAFKNEAFAEEQEWGIVVRPQITLSKKATWPKNDEDSRWLHIRAGRNLMIPYTRILPSVSSLPITSVRFGPSIDKIRAESSLNTLLLLNRYESVKIHGSDIPVLL